MAVKKEMYAIVDIETTGGYAVGNKITEIAIFLHDGGKLIDSYDTLINPEQPIPEYITGLTGISDKMVADAPTFAEVADDVYKWLDGKIFVAHNVHFDYSFIKKEFENLNISISHKKLCTVRLSRKLIPGLSSYGLGNLSKSLGVEINGRHRAAGDAQATATIFHHLLERDTNNYIQEYLKRNSKESMLPPNLSKANYEDLPESPGVYYFHDKNDKIIYVGKAIDIKKRINGHFSGSKGTWSNSNIKNEIHRISFDLTGNELIALLHENEQILKYWPKYNQAQKHFDSHWGIYSYEDQNGYLRLVVSKAKKNAPPLISMYTHGDLWHFLIQKIKEEQLCLKLCGIQKLNGPCTEVENGNCLGACEELEDPATYNQRLKGMLNSFYDDRAHYALVGEGRTEEELAFALIKDGKYAGIGYFHKNTSIDLIEDLHPYLISHQENRYSLQVIRAFAEKMEYKMIGELTEID